MLQQLRDWGFKGIRFGVYVGQCMPTSSSIDASYFARGVQRASGPLQPGEPSGNSIDEIVDWCADLGIYVLLCPAWTSYWIPPTWATTASGGVGVTCPDAPDIHVDVLNNPTVRAAMVDLYAFLANRYANKYNVIFEGFNELESQGGDQQAWADFNEMWLTSVEQNEGSISHVKVVELFYNWGQYNYILTPPFITNSHPNVILATHSYPFTEWNDQQQRPTDTEIDDLALHWANAIHNAGYPWMDTEWAGYYLQSYFGDKWAMLARGMTMFNKYNSVGFGYFTYDNGDPAYLPFNLAGSTNAAAILSYLQPTMAGYDNWN